MQAFGSFFLHFYAFFLKFDIPSIEKRHALKSQINALSAPFHISPARDYMRSLCVHALYFSPSSLVYFFSLASFVWNSRHRRFSPSLALLPIFSLLRHVFALASRASASPVRFGLNAGVVHSLQGASAPLFFVFRQISFDIFFVEKSPFSCIYQKFSVILQRKIKISNFYAGN